MISTTTTTSRTAPTATANEHSSRSSIPSRAKELVIQTDLSTGDIARARTKFMNACQRGGPADLALIKRYLSHGVLDHFQDSEGWTPLSRALLWGHSEIACLLLNYWGVDNEPNLSRLIVDQELNFATTPALAEAYPSYTLIDVATLGRGTIDSKCEMIAKLVDHLGCDPRSLCLAIDAGSLTGVTALLKEGISPNDSRLIYKNNHKSSYQVLSNMVPANRSVTPLHLAAAGTTAHHPAIVKLLLEYGGDSQLYTCNYAYLDHLRASLGDFWDSDESLRKASRTVLAETPIVTALTARAATTVEGKVARAQIVDLLLQAGGDGKQLQNELYQKTKLSLLHLAVYQDNLPLVATITNFIAGLPRSFLSGLIGPYWDLSSTYLNAQDLMGKSVAYLASRQDQLDILAYLIHMGVNLNLGAKQDWRPLHVASARCTEVIVKQSDVEINAKTTDFGTTPLLFASFEKARILLSAGASVDCYDKWGFTPLYYAITSPEPDYRLIELLLKFGASTSGSFGIGSDKYSYLNLIINKFVREAQNPSENSNLIIANLCRILDLIIRNGANVNQSSGKDRLSPLFRLLAVPGSDAPIRLLLEHGAKLQKFDVSTFCDHEIWPSISNRLARIQQGPRGQVVSTKIENPFKETYSRFQGESAIEMIEMTHNSETKKPSP